MEGVSGAFPSRKQDWEYDFTQIDALMEQPFRYGKGGKLQISESHKKLAQINPDLALAQVVNQLDDFLINKNLNWTLSTRKQAIEEFMKQYGTQALTAGARYNTIEEFLDDYYSGNFKGGLSFREQFKTALFTS